MTDQGKVTVGPVTVGANYFVVIAGPCAIESEGQFADSAIIAKSHGAAMLRGGVYKLRTSPASFQGLGEEGLRIAQKIRKDMSMPVVTEVTDPRQIPQLIDAVDVLQVGTRNMHNYPLLKELGLSKKPILLKRGFSATIEEWLLAAEYIERQGNPNIILCERGIRTFETAIRNTLDLAAVAFVKQRSSLPVMVDPSHATGDKHLIIPMSLAAIAAGADGLLVEIHPNAASSLSDGAQAIDGEMFALLMKRTRELLPLFGRTLSTIL